MTSQATAPTYTDLRARHTKGYRTTSDETWDRDPVCNGCDGAWPCDTTVALDIAETMRGDVHHHVNPVIGWFRLRFSQATGGADILTVPSGPDRLPDLTGLPETVAIETRTLVSAVRKMQAATDATDMVIEP